MDDSSSIPKSLLYNSPNPPNIRRRILRNGESKPYTTLSQEPYEYKEHENTPVDNYFSKQIYIIFTHFPHIISSAPALHSKLGFFTLRIDPSIPLDDLRKHYDLMMQPNKTWTQWRERWDKEYESGKENVKNGGEGSAGFESTSWRIADPSTYLPLEVKERIKEEMWTEDKSKHPLKERWHWEREWEHEDGLRQLYRKRCKEERVKMFEERDREEKTRSEEREPARDDQKPTRDLELPESPEPTRKTDTTAPGKRDRLRSFFSSSSRGIR